jgi:hypothetical protein
VKFPTKSVLAANLKRKERERKKKLKKKITMSHVAGFDMRYKVLKRQSNKNG